MRSMEQNKDGWPNKIELFPRLARVGKFLNRAILGPHLFASHGDHLFEHPLDTPLEPVTDWPLESDGIDRSCPDVRGLDV